MSSTTSAEKLLARGPAVDPEDEVVDSEIDNSEESTEAEETTEDTSEESTTEETSEEELPENIKAILAKNRAEAKQAKAELLALKKQIKSDETKPASTEAPETTDRYKTLFINTAAKTALTEAGLKSGTDRFLKMLDMDALEVDDEGNITGLEDQVAALTEEFADLIKTSNTPTRKIVKTDAAGRKETPVAPKSSAEKLLARVNAKR